MATRQEIQIDEMVGKRSVWFRAIYVDLLPQYKLYEPLKSVILAAIESGKVKGTFPHPSRPVTIRWSLH